ncbi:hypothetical protein F4780DRAFT_772208 [Xylariomycetidae sp. FL0641]|nr:hypothetical protein F4780DRAFT_772208 [Xylariomycetidae sp. FL0641]
MADKGDYDRKEDEDEEEDELNETDYKAQKDALIFAIRVSDSMLKPPPPSDDKKADKDPPVYAALKSAYQVMQQRIISNPKDMMAIILFGTEKTKRSEGQTFECPHCYVYTDLDVPAAEDVKALKELVENGEDADEVLKPAKETTIMSHLLFVVKHLFSTRAPNFGSRRLFLITDDDDPHAADPERAKRNDGSATQAKDLYDCGAKIELFPIIYGDSKFDFSKFYDDIIYRDPAASQVDPTRVTTSRSGDGLTLLNSLVSKINSRQTPKRAYFSNMSFELGPGLTISVKGYIILQKQAPARSCYVWLDGEKAQIAVGETSRLAEDSARTVENTEVKKAYKFGGEFVKFSEEEQKSIKQFGPPVIRIIGFKDRPLLPFWASLKKSTFIFPSEDGYVGSTRVFTALWQKLLKSKKIGLAWHIARANGNPQLVAIIPSPPQSDEKSGSYSMPAGLWLYPVPYADDVREGPEKPKMIRTTNELTDKMNTVVRQLQFPGASYDPSKYPNPSLQWHYRILQALALEEEVPEQPDDATMPKYRAIHKRCGGYIQDWSKMADDALEKVREQQAIKRELDGDEDENSRPAKKPKPTTTKSSAGGGGLSNAELKKRDKAGSLSKLTVAELKAVMGERDLDTKGLKKELVERLEQWIEDNVHVCTSVEDLRNNLRHVIASKSSPDRAQHVSCTFELRPNSIFYLTADAENANGDGVEPTTAPDLPVSRTVTASETVLNQPPDNPVLQRSVAKHIVSALGAEDGSSWTTRSVIRNTQGWTLTYICKASRQAWDRANAKSSERPPIASFSGNGGLDPTNLSRPAFDCRGSLTIAFSKFSREISVKYEHTPLHRTVKDLVDRLAPLEPPPPVNNGNMGSQKTPKVKRPPPAEGEEGSSRKKRQKKKKGNAPEAPMDGTSADGQAEASNGTGAAQNDIHLTSILNVPPEEAERRRTVAMNLLSSRGIPPETLSPEQFNIFANQAPNLQSSSLEMLAKYGAERLRIVHPDDKDPAASASSTPVPAQSANATTATGTAAAPATTETPTKKKRRNTKKKSEANATEEVSIGDGAVVPVEENGDLGTTDSALKPKARKTRGACDTCRQNKRKVCPSGCGKQHPVCSTCADFGVDCVYLPPKPRRKSGKLPEVGEQADTDGAEDSELFPSHAPYQSDVPPPPMHTQHTQEPTPAPVEEAPVAPAPAPAHEPSVAPALEPAAPAPAPDPDNEEFIPDPNILSGPVEHSATAPQSSATDYFSNQPQNGGLTFPHVSGSHVSAGTMPNLSYSDNTAGLTFPAVNPTTRRSLPSAQTRQTPVPPPHIPAQTPSPTMTQQQAYENVHQPVAQAPSQPAPSHQSVVTRSPYQSSARTNTPPAAQPTTSTAYHSPSVTPTVPQYDSYSRYNTTTDSQIPYEPGSYQPQPTTTTASYSSTPSYDYTRTATNPNPLSQALNNSTGYGSSSTAANNQWPTSQTRGTSASTSHPSAPNASYNQQASAHTQQSQQHCQASYNTSRDHGYGSSRSGMAGYSSNEYGDSDLSYLLRANGNNH